MIDELIKIFGQQGVAVILGTFIGLGITFIGSIIIGIISYFKTRLQVSLSAKYAFLQKALDNLIVGFNEKIILDAIDFNENKLKEDIYDHTKDLNYEQLKEVYPLKLEEFFKITSEFYRNAYFLSNKKYLVKKHKEVKIAIKNINNDFENYKEAIIKKAIFQTAFQASILNELDYISQKLK